VALYKYSDLLEEIDKFNALGVETGNIGDSSLGLRVPYVFVGEKGKNNLIVQGAIHAREHITSLLVINQAKFLVKRPELLLRGGIYFIPMSNPDGVRICQEGLSWISDKKTRARLLEINGSNDFSMWKANANGVDINVNFDAKWSKGKENVFYPHPANYVGKSPNSEIETLNLVRFTTAAKPLCTLSYHTKGEIVYWRFGQNKSALWRDYRLAKAIANQLGYRLDDGTGSVGGYKDWCIEKLGIPAFTFEVGSDNYGYPYPYADFQRIYTPNRDLPRKILNYLVKEKEEPKNKTDTQ